MKPIQTRHGFWVLESDDWISRWANESGRLDHDQYLVPQITSWIKEGDHVIDAGCYIGDHTIAYQRKVGSTGKIVAVDPNIYALTCCRRNVPECVCVNAFISNTASDTAFMELDEKNCGASRVADVDCVGRLDNVVQSMKIDDIVFSPMLNGRCDLIKMDLEGYEVFAIEGAMLTIGKLRPIIVIEINRGALQRHNFDYETIMAGLENFDYKIITVPFDCKLTDPQYDIICVPKEKYAERRTNPA